MTGSSDEDIYCGVIKINTFRKAFFLGQINDLEMDVMDVGDAWLHGFTNKRQWDPQQAQYKLVKVPRQES